MAYLSTAVIFISIISVSLAECPSIISRDDWGARLPTDIYYTVFPLDYVIIHHTVTPSCTTVSECSEVILSIQDYHLDRVDYGDIAYNFMIGGDGNIYEGRGWHLRGAHTYGYNSRSIGIGFIGDYRKLKPSEAQLKSAQDLLECGVELGELARNYKLFGGRQVFDTESPGNMLYNKIQHWNNFATPTPADAYVPE